MTSSPVMGAGMMVNTSIRPGTQNVNKTDFSDFKNLMGQAQRKINNLSNDLHGKNAGSEITDTSAKEVTKDVKTDDRVSKIKQVSADKVEDTNVTDDQIKEVSKAIDDVKKALSEEFNISDEEIEAVLANLGLNQMALLDSQNIPEIVAKITGAEDTLSIVTDEAAYDSMTKVTKTVEDAIKALSEELNIPVEEIEENVKQFEVIKEDLNTGLSDLSNKGDENAISNKDTEETFESKVFVVGKDNGKRTFSLENRVDNLENTVKEEVKIDTDLRKSGDFDKNSSPNNAPMTFAENLFAKVAESLNEEAGQAGYTSFDAKNIMNQITEFIKVDFSAENPEVSLKLHPETLGTVSVKLSSNNEGLLTAQFIAQNESVKAVIESQAMVLKENLESKGVTVEAVEVLVQSHAFERNLNDESRGNEAGNNNSFARRTRRITLFEDEEETISEDDALAKEIMIQNGNTVDYSV